MAGRMDRRAARTQKALHNALLSLILSKGYEATTVQDIIDEADIGRSTFYAHYTGKEDLLRSGFQTLRADLAEAQRAVAAKSEGARDELLGFSLAMFEHADRYKQIYRALVGERGGTIAVAEIRRILSEVVKEELSDVEDNEAVPKEVRVQFVVGAFLTTLTWWLEQRPKLAPYQVNPMFRHLVLNGIDRSNSAASGQG